MAFSIVRQVERTIHTEENKVEYYEKGISKKEGSLKAHPNQLTAITLRQDQLPISPSTDKHAKLATLKINEGKGEEDGDTRMARVV